MSGNLISQTRQLESLLERGHADWMHRDSVRQSFSGMLFEAMKEKKIDVLQLAALLTESPYNIRNDGKPKAEFASNERKVVRWLSGEDIPEKRESVFQLCILLGMNTAESRTLFEKGLQWSWVHEGNCNELIYAFCIDCGMGIETACTLIEKWKTYPLEKKNMEQVRNEEGTAVENRQTVIRGQTEIVANQYHAFLKMTSEVSDKAVKVKYFEEFLESNKEYFHLCRVTRWKLFQEVFFAQFLEQGYEVSADIDYAEWTRSNNNKTVLADALIDLHMPDYRDIDNVYHGLQDAQGLKSRQQVEKNLAGSNPDTDNSLRGPIGKYLSGEKDIPRDIFIQTYILVTKEGNADIMDLNALLAEAGYPLIYVRAASGLDALVYYLLNGGEPKDHYYMAFRKEVERLRAELRLALDNSMTEETAKEAKKKKQQERKKLKDFLTRNKEK